MGETGFTSLWLQLNTWNQWWRMKGGGVQLHLRKALLILDLSNMARGPWVDWDPGSGQTLMQAAPATLSKLG